MDRGFGRNKDEYVLIIFFQTEGGYVFEWNV